MPALPRSIIAFIIVLGILVFVHEYGHYLAARWRKVHVETFSIGFGRALYSWRDSLGTVWKLGWVPLGGYVKLHGQERPEDASAETRASWLPGRTFHEKSVLSRAIIVAAGPIANFVLAIVLYFALFAVIGIPRTLPEIGEVLADSAALRAGVMAGDRITGIDNVAVERFEDVQRVIQANAGHQVVLHVERAGAKLDLPITPDAYTDATGRRLGKMGVRGGRLEFVPVSLTVAAMAGVEQTWDITVQTLDGVWGMISQRRSGEDLGGPLRIAQMSGEVANLGFSSMVSFIALLSVNLGLINLFPIPVLDGGHLMFFAAEALRGRPLSTRAQEYGYRAGFALLIGLFVFATWNDLGHIGLFRWVASLIG
ncbi:MAG: RIP metalloprotease RseP [Alphaproteobacteria bacterium]|nr:RIP metalloprotease RseP [Alphaproteobacteria bacterium]